MFLSQKEKGQRKYLIEQKITHNLQEPFTELSRDVELQCRGDEHHGTVAKNKHITNVSSVHPRVASLIIKVGRRLGCL